MNQSSDKRKIGWIKVALWASVFWLAVVWLIFIPAIVVKPSVLRIVSLIVLTAIPVGITIYAVRRGRKVSMGAFQTLKDELRDKTRDELCAKLCAIGLDASLAERGRPEERVDGGAKGKSLGLIEIRDSPIRWVNVLRHTYGPAVSPGGGGVGGGTTYVNVYLVHDPNVPKEGYLELKSVRVKNFWSGKVVDLRWKVKIAMVGGVPALARKSIPGKTESNLVNQMNEDVSLKESLIRVKEHVRIRSFPPWGWGISASVTSKQPSPSREQWDRYETIARYLLESSK